MSWCDSGDGLNLVLCVVVCVGVGGVRKGWDGRKRMRERKGGRKGIKKGMRNWRERGETDRRERLMIERKQGRDRGKGGGRDRKDRVTRERGREGEENRKEGEGETVGELRRVDRAKESNGVVMT